MSYIGRTPTVGNFQICDAISVVNNQAAYTMQVGSVNVSPESANHMIVSLNGVIQKPNSSYTVAGAVITFSSNLVTGDVIDFIQILGDVLDLGVPSDATVSTAKLASTSVTAAKLNNDIITGQTALTSVASDDTVLISDTSASGALRKMTRANFVSGIGGTNTPYFYAYLNSNQTFGTTTSTKIAFGHETLDSANGFNVSNHEYTIPSGQGGKWWIFFQVRRAGFAGARFFADMYSGSTALLSAESNGGSDSYDTTSGAGLFDLAAGDVLKVEAYHTDSGNRSINGQAKSTFFGGYKLIT